MIYSKINFAILIAIALYINGCSSKRRIDYSIHKPKVRFTPSQRALDRLKRETMGHKYVWGAENDGCYDCSGLTYYTFGTMGVEIPRVANDQFNSGTPVSRDELQKGDLVFFATSRSRPGIATHVGIYLGNGKFQHASSAKKRVIVSSLNSPYYSSHYLGARRYYNFGGYERFKPQRVVESKNIKVSTPINKISYNSNLNNQTSQPVNNIQPLSQKEQYYILLHSSANVANELITKLELSGLQSSVTSGGGTILVGPFNSEAEAMKIKEFNSQILANAQIKRL